MTIGTKTVELRKVPFDFRDLIAVLGAQSLGGEACVWVVMSTIKPKVSPNKHPIPEHAGLLRKSQQKGLVLQCFFASTPEKASV